MKRAYVQNVWGKLLSVIAASWSFHENAMTFRDRQRSHSYDPTDTNNDRDVDQRVDTNHSERARWR